MNTLPHKSETAEDSAGAAPVITIIYEDRIAGLRAKRFSDMLIASLGGEPAAPPACWRSELLDLPEIAQEISRDAGSSEFVIFSLRGDTHLSRPTKTWIESWLEGATGGAASLVALFDSERSTASHAESSRYYLRHVTANAGVAFFAHCALAPREQEITILFEDDEPAAKPVRRRRAQNVLASLFPTCAAA